MYVAQGFNPWVKNYSHSTALARDRLAKTWHVASKMETDPLENGLWRHSIRCGYEYTVRGDTNGGRVETRTVAEWRHGREQKRHECWRRGHRQSGDRSIKSTPEETCDRGFGVLGSTLQVS